MAALESTLGIDSTDKERQKVRKSQSVLLKEIKKIDEVTFKRLSYE